jgi:hypothetical protein
MAWHDDIEDDLDHDEIIKRRDAIRATWTEEQRAFRAGARVFYEDDTHLTPRSVTPRAGWIAMGGGAYQKVRRVQGG